MMPSNCKVTTHTSIYKRSIQPLHQPFKGLSSKYCFASWPLQRMRTHIS